MSETEWLLKLASVTFCMIILMCWIMLNA